MASRVRRRAESTTSSWQGARVSGASRVEQPTAAGAAMTVCMLLLVITRLSIAPAFLYHCYLFEDTIASLLRPRADRLSRQPPLRARTALRAPSPPKGLPNVHVDGNANTYNIHVNIRMKLHINTHMSIHSSRRPLAASSRGAPRLLWSPPAPRPGPLPSTFDAGA